jgi:hypothetical protein
VSTAFEPVPWPARRLDPVEQGILWPVVYASIFRAPVRASRLLGQIVGVRASEAEMRRALAGRALREFLVEEDGLIWLRRPELLALRSAFAVRETATRRLLDRHHAVLSFLRALRGVRLAALSGGCAHDAADDEDIDVFAVTEPHALWRTLVASTLVAKARGWRRVLCLNYLVDATAQALPFHDFYAAFELISLKPVKGDSAFSELLAANPWVEPIFPNFLRSRVCGQNPGNQTDAPAKGRLLEAAARMIHRPYLRHRLPESTGVELSDHVVRLHSTDHRARIRGLFQDALQNLGMEAPSWI